MGEVLDISLKHRLVGATVLVAIGVIFIPILLERGREESRLTVSMEIPPKPSLEFEDRLDNVDLPEIESVPSMEKSVAPIKQEYASQPEKKPAIVNEPEPSEPDVTPPTSKAPQKAKAAPAKSTVADKKVATPEKWIIQVGSFSRKANAGSLSDKLNNIGFNTFVESAKTDAGPVFRVRIGPFGKRKAAEEVVKKLNTKGGYRSMVISYP